MSMFVTRSLPALALVTATAATAWGQSLPTSQPKMLTIYREQVKVGHAGPHAKVEAGWPAAFAKAKSPNYYLALVSVTGPTEAWFLSPWDSYASWGKSLAEEQGNPELSAELDRLSMADAEHVESLRIIEAMARPDLSHGKYPDLNKARFWEITTYRVRPGHEDKFEAAAKAYKGMAARNDPNAAWRIYQVSAGMVGPTFLIFSSVNAFAEFDAMMASGEKMWKSITPEEKAVFDKFGAEGMITGESNRFRLDPNMSYVSAETRASDPAFWGKK
jgi:hypothetical protein